MDPRVPHLIDLVRQHELYFTARAQEDPRPDMADVYRAFFADVWDPFYARFTRLSDPDVARSIDVLGNELSRIRAIAAVNGISTPDLGTSQHGYTQLSGATPAMTPTTIVGRARYNGVVPAKDRLVNIAPVLAPGQGGLSVKLALAGDQLTADVCIDGKMYRGQADLSALADYIDRSLQTWHTRQHRNTDLAVMPRGARFANTGQPLIGASVGYCGESDDALGHPYVQACGEALVGALVEQHQREFVAGWWHDLEHAVDKAYKDVRHTVITTVKSLKGPIEDAAKAAISVAAAAIPGGALIAPVAQNLAGSLITAATGSGPQKQAAQQAVAQATQAAATDPNAAAALQLAKQNVAQATVATQTVQTVADAAAGNPQATQQVAQLAQAAQAGDPGAQAAIQVVQAMPGASDQLQAVLAQLAQLQQQVQQQGAQQSAALAQVQQGQAQLQQQYAADDSDSDSALAASFAAPPTVTTYGNGSVSITPTGGPPGQVVSGDSPRIAAMQMADQSAGQVVAVVLRSDGSWTTKTFANSDDADDWYGLWLNQPKTYLYAAYFDKGDATYPYPLNEQVSPDAPGAAPGGQPHMGVGPWMPILFTPIEAGLTALLAGGAGYLYGSGHPKVSGEYGGGYGQPQVGAGFLVPALAAAGGFAAGRWGHDAWEWTKAQWEAHRAAKAAGQ